MAPINLPQKAWAELCAERRRWLWRRWLSLLKAGRGCWPDAPNGPAVCYCRPLLLFAMVLRADGALERLGRGSGQPGAPAIRSSAPAAAPVQGAGVGCATASAPAARGDQPAAGGTKHPAPPTAGRANPGPRHPLPEPQSDGVLTRPIHDQPRRRAGRSAVHAMKAIRQRAG